MPSKPPKNEEAYLLDLRVQSLWSPYFFAKNILGADDLTIALHKSENDSFLSRFIAGHHKQFIEWPRGFFKTTTFTQGTGLWFVLPVKQQDTDYAVGVLGIPEDVWMSRAKLHNQDLKQLIAMETDKNAMKKVGEIKSQLESNELLRALFPEIAYQGTEEPWNASCIRVRRVGVAKHHQEGTFEAIGVGVALQSRHYDIVWEDDLVGERAIKSPSEMEDTIGWHRRLAGAFVNAGDQVRFGVSNRWAYNDLNSYVRTNEPDFIFHTRRAWEDDPATGERIATFPERYPLNRLEQIRKGMSEYEFSCQYLNRPTMPGETQVDTSKLHRHERLDSERFKCSCGKTYYIQDMLVSVHIDPSQARPGSQSRTCVSVIGTTRDKHIFLIEVWQRRNDYSSLEQTIISCNDAYRPYVITYEDVNSQNMLQWHLEQKHNSQEFRAAKHRRFTNIKPMPTKSKKKEDRIKDFFFPFIQREQFSYNFKTEGGKSFIQQLETFPFPALDHDYDLLDTMAQGAALPWRFPLTEDVARERKDEEDEYLRHLGKPYSGSAQCDLR